MRKHTLIAVILVSLVVTLYIAISLLIPVQPQNKYFEVEIRKGATYREVANMLSEMKLIRDSTVFLALGRITGADRKIKAGYYSLWGSMSPLEIFRTIKKGQIIQYEVRVLEGDSIFEIANTFERLGLMTKSELMEIAYDPGFLSVHGIQSASVEGYIYPDTYSIPKGIDKQDAIGMMVRRMRVMYSGKLLERTKQLGMTENQVLTLASIIEKEAVMDSERPLISGVYHNRLKKRMRLQADPTAVYGVKRSGERIFRSDLLRETPFNTYTIEGLPPGPIASPGIKSIRAALYPADIPYLFFVSKDNMTHHFSTTAREHLEAVEQYRRMRQSLKDSESEPEAGQPDNDS